MNRQNIADSLKCPCASDHVTFLTQSERGCSQAMKPCSVFKAGIKPASADCDPLVFPHGAATEAERGGLTTGWEQLILQWMWRRIHSGTMTGRGAMSFLLRLDGRDNSWSDNVVSVLCRPEPCLPSDRSRDPRFPVLRRIWKRFAASALLDVSVVVWFRRFSERRSRAESCRPFCWTAGLEEDFSFWRLLMAGRFLEAELIGTFLLLTWLTVEAVSTSDSPERESSMWVEEPPFFELRPEPDEGNLESRQDRVPSAS
ncbi:hypothetical protein EYF80_053290 [Liparis tanakae]|uniref:Uncharacterized protein n=1 Tax=Liparis tanakae TaxID=230148 RepID=A0A4Z2F6Q3_9TELE|nr:hypothetical protein EYF80_053290 [Liparis tanakae]